MTSTHAGAKFLIFKRGNQELLKGENCLLIHQKSNQIL